MDLNAVIIIIGLAVAVLMVIIYTLSIYWGQKSIFSGSGSPISMAQMLLSSLQTSGQMLFGLLAVVILALLILNKIISSDAGLPMFSAVVAYLLGKTYKDISFLPRKKDVEDKGS